MSLLSRFVKNAYLGIVLDKDGYETTLIVLKSKKEIFSETKHFGMLEEGIPKLLLTYMEDINQEYQIVYYSTLLDSINQGAVPSCDKEVYRAMEISTGNAVTVCINGSWSIFASNYDIQNYKSFFEPLGGLDMIFSAFLVLFEMQKRALEDTALQDSTILLVLRLKTSSTTAIFRGDKLQFGGYFIFQYEVIDSKKEDNSTKVVESRHVESHDDALVDLDDVALELSDDFGAWENSSLENGSAQESENRMIDDISTLGVDLQLLEFLKTSLSGYYKSELYDPSFVDQIVVCDPYTDGGDLPRLFEDELMISTEATRINLSEIICRLGIQEVG